MYFRKSVRFPKKNFSTQQYLLAMLEKWKKSVNNGEAFSALLMDLPKAFDCLEHELLIAKLNAYGFSLSELKLIHDDPSKRKQRTKNLFFIIENFDIVSYTDDNTPCLNNIDGVVKSLEEASTKLFKWFSDNLRNSNAGKCHLLVSTNNTVNIRV